MKVIYFLKASPRSVGLSTPAPMGCPWTCWTEPSSYQPLSTTRRNWGRSWRSGLKRRTPRYQTTGWQSSLRSLTRPVWGFIPSLWSACSSRYHFDSRYAIQLISVAGLACKKRKGTEIAIEDIKKVKKLTVLFFYFLSQTVLRSTHCFWTNRGRASSWRNMKVNTCSTTPKFRLPNLMLNKWRPQLKISVFVSCAMLCPVLIKSCLFFCHPSTFLLYYFWLVRFVLLRSPGLSSQQLLGQLQTNIKVQKKNPKENWDNDWAEGRL